MAVVLKKTKYHRCKALRTVGKQWSTWMMQVKKAKAIYHTMNLFTLDITKNCLIGQCWVPDMDLIKVNDVMERCSAKIGTNIPSFMSKTDTIAIPPTYHRTNKFTSGFQALINAYGDSSYRELNPGRYVILLMGLFSMYCGFLYNDIFAKPIYLAKSFWKNTYSVTEITNQKFLELNPSLETNRPYALGVDPIWEFATNKIMTQNSMKMKLSIIIGIIHMIFGLSLSLLNHIYFRRTHAIFLQFIPQILFLCCLFLWLVILIYMKWFMFSSKTANIKRSSGCAPLILILFIDMMLLSTTKPVGSDCDAYMFPGQQTVQKALLFIALLCVPILFFGTPLYVYTINKKEKDKAMAKISQFRRYQRRDSDKKAEDLLLAEVAKYSISFGELMIHQAIRSIEFVLSTVSHTASYLRLWALSLAHQQLSEMLWRMIMSKLALKDRTPFGPLKIFVVFYIWAIFTVSILVVMEGLSAFLHTLRLHWVEFMSKFYDGDGYPFQPLTFKDLWVGGDMDKDQEPMCKKRKRLDM